MRLGSLICKRSERGFSLIAAGASAFALFGMAGLAIDVGRVYITKGEAQNYADSAAVAAAIQLDSQGTALTRADAAVAANPNTWNFSTNAFTGTVVEYSANGTTGWAASGAAVAANMRYARVTATVSNLPLLLLPMVGTATTSTVKALAVAGHVAAPPVGLFPYSPISHTEGATAAAVQAIDPNFGFTPGVQYTLKWPNDPTKKAPCDGDNAASWINRQWDGGSEHGEIVISAASGLTGIIDGLKRTDVLDIGLDRSVQPTSGNKSSVNKAFNDRAGYDGDQTSMTYAAYIANPLHNGSRLIVALVNSGYNHVDRSPLDPSEQTIGVGWAQFLLLPSGNYKSGGGESWCAIYVGNSPTLGGSDGSGSSGGFGLSAIRITQ